MFAAHLLLEALEGIDGRCPIALQPVQPHQAPPGMFGGRAQRHDAFAQHHGGYGVAAGLALRRLAGPGLGLTGGDAVARCLQPAVEFLQWPQVAAGQQRAFGVQRIGQQVDRDTCGQLQHRARFDHRVPGAVAQLKQSLAAAHLTG